jgi:hypothetical protein
MVGNSTKTNDASPREIRKYDYYFRDRQFSIQLENSTISSFEKTLTTLASGALGFSITFVNFFVEGQIRSKSLLFMAWVFFGVSLTTVLLGFLFSRLGQAKYRDIIEKLYRNPRYPWKNRYAIITDYLNWASFFTFLIGVALFALFAGRNL